MMMPTGEEIVGALVTLIIGILIYINATKGNNHRKDDDE